MLKVERFTNSVVVYDEDEKRGLAFPITDTTPVGAFMREVQDRAANVIMRGVQFTLLGFNPENRAWNYPMAKFLNGKAPGVLNDDAEVAKLYKYYFEHTIPQINLLSNSYFFNG